MTRTLLIPVCCCLAAAYAQQPVVLLDPARGGSESGARIAERLEEKQVTLDTATRLASLLRARGFTVAMTREADVDVSNDARAALANNLHPIACILLHATGAGAGVHLYTSALHQGATASGSPTRWDEAQAAYADRSQALETDLGTALQHSKLKASSGRTWMRPLDNMQCPAVAIEVAPDKDGTGPEDSTYQAQITNALANTLLQWRGKVAGMAPPEAQPAPVVAPKPSTVASTDKTIPTAAPSAPLTSAPPVKLSSPTTVPPVTAAPKSVTTAAPPDRTEP